MLKTSTNLHQISANWGPDSTFAVEANTKTLCPKSSLFWLVKMMDRGWVIRPLVEYWVEYRILGENTNTSVGLDYSSRYLSKIQVFDSIPSQISAHHSAYYLTLNIGQIPVLFWIAKWGRVICQSLICTYFSSVQFHLLFFHIPYALVATFLLSTVTIGIWLLVFKI